MPNNDDANTKKTLEQQIIERIPKDILEQMTPDDLADFVQKLMGDPRLDERLDEMEKNEAEWTKTWADIREMERKALRKLKGPGGADKLSASRRRGTAPGCRDGRSGPAAGGVSGSRSGGPRQRMGT